MNIYEKLEVLQQEYKAPKSEYNSHGGFKYRTLEKMLETLKPMLKKHKVMLLFKDTLENCADTPHIVAHANLINLETPEEQITVTSMAQEAAIQKGMQAAQISGSTSSYARKYALAALLLVDESEEIDSKQGDQTDWDAEIKAAKDAISSELNSSEVLTLDPFLFFSASFMIFSVFFNFSANPVIVFFSA
jgi:hypothetical protein